MKIHGLHHVNIKVNDLDRAKDFYGSTLGLSTRDDGPMDRSNGVWFNLGSQQLHISRGEVRPSNGQHFAIELDDLRGVLAGLEKAGVEIVNDRSATAIIADPSGNLIELRSA